MHNETITIRTSIEPDLQRKMVLKGTLLAGSGTFLLVASALYLPLSSMRHWGIVIFILSGLLICLGLIPYRKLSLLTLKPNELVLDKTGISFFQKGNLLMEIPEATIDKLFFMQKDALYGMGIRLKEHPLEKIRITKPQISIKDFVDYTGNVLFFPYFTQKTCQFFIQEFTANQSD